MVFASCIPKKVQIWFKVIFCLTNDFVVHILNKDEDWFMKKKSVTALIPCMVTNAHFSTARKTASDNRAVTWQNQQNECGPSKDSDQPGHSPSLIRVFTVHMKKPWVLSYPLSAHTDSDQTGRMPRLIWVFAWRPSILLVLTCRGSYACAVRPHCNHMAQHSYIKVLGISL